LRRRIIVTALLVAATAVPAAAAPPASPPGWATVNVCDPGSNAVGVRAGLPGPEKAFARFTVQWLDPKDSVWKPVEGTPMSPWVATGSAVEVGWTYSFDQPPPGTTFQIRGVAELQWRKPGGALARNQTVVTGACALS